MKYLFLSFGKPPIFDLKIRQQSSEKGMFFGFVNSIDAYLERSDELVCLMGKP